MTFKKALVFCVVVLSLGLIGIRPVYGAEYPPDILRYVLFQTEAVMNDVALYLGWDVEDKEGLQKACKEAISHIDELLEDLSGINVKDYEGLVKDERDGLLSLREIYTRILKERVSDKEIESLFSGLEPKMMKVAKGVAELNKAEFKTCPEINLDEVILKNLPKDKKDLYQRALAEIKADNLKSACELLGDLISSMGDATITYCLRYKKIDVEIQLFGRGEYKEEGVPEERMIALGEEVFKKEVYLPCLSEIFRSWRHYYQIMWGGVSNWSHIYNWEYNKVRLKLSSLIREYLSDHPNDKIARAQLCHLWLDTNILRGGPFGNSVLGDGMWPVEE